MGFTSLFEQNLASIALAWRLKWHFPQLRVVFGGPNVEAIMGETLHRRLPFIDFICSGEADETFPELIKRLGYDHPVHDLPGIVFRSGTMSVATRPAPMVTDSTACRCRTTRTISSVSNGPTCRLGSIPAF